jgi:hypothetical protein
MFEDAQGRIEPRPLNQMAQDGPNRLQKALKYEKEILKEQKVIGRLYHKATYAVLRNDFGFESDEIRKFDKALEERLEAMKFERR